LKRILECFLIAICGGTFCDAQQTISTAGGEANGAGGTVSFTIGQMDYITLTSNSGIVSLGVQQPFEILVISGIDEAEGISLEISVYPNPISDFLRLKLGSYNFEKLYFKLYDFNGSLVRTGEILSKETVIQTGDLAPAVYYLQINDNENEVKTFKIIKN